MGKDERGGIRPGAGRKPGSGPFGEPTRTVRVPESRVGAVVAYLNDFRQPAAPPNEPGTALALDPRPLVTESRCGGVRVAESVPAGFPSPAADYVEEVMDLNAHLIRQGHQDATYIMRVQGHSMHDAGIHDGDEVIVDRAIDAVPGHIVVAILNGELTIKRLLMIEGRPVLHAENSHFKRIELRDGDSFEIWGVVTRCLHKL